MFWQNSDSQIIQHGNIGRFQSDLHCAVIRSLDPCDILIVGCDLRGIVRIHDRIQCKLHICGGKGLTVMEFYIFSQMKGVGL